MSDEPARIIRLGVLRADYVRASHETKLRLIQSAGSCGPAEARACAEALLSIAQADRILADLGYSATFDRAHAESPK